MNSLQGNLAREPSPVITRSTRSDGVRTPQPKPGTPRPASTSPAESNNRPLNVTDALGYLDAVKKQFETEPDVYNKFLDIMKDFKGQVIDTPGVIERVSALFHGNVVLIEGFNTFLPAGYRINANADDQTITVTTPMGTTTQSTSGGYTHRMQARDTIPGLGPNIAMPFPGMGPSTNVLPPLSSGPASRSMTPVAYHIPAQPPPSLPPSFEPPPYQNPQTAAAANLLGNLNNRNQVERPQQHAGEFNHAIQYLNKIKSRFVDDSNTYKNFLDILQTYQKEQKQNPHVFVQVQHLFKDAPDLLTEFRLFLPEFAAVESQSTPSWPLPEPAAEKPTKKAPAAAKRKKRGAEKDVTPVPVPKPAARPAKKAKHNHKPEPGSPSSFSGYVGQTPPPVSMPPPTISTFHQSAAAANLPAVIGEKVMFFDRARKALGARDMFDDLLKLLSLFSSEIIGMSTLITLARDSFFGDSDLMQEFKDLVGWEDPEDAADKGPPGSVRTGPPDLASAYVPDDGDGPSYRRLPDSESRLACSGRDELGKSVLNDEWVSHPAWASEDAGFMSHRKNLFEDTLHKSEEERHEYHVHIAAMSRTIAHFEPLAMRLEEMTSEERVNFKLQADFGGSAKALYHRIIRKVYGRDSGLEIIQALQDSPSIAVPVVLARLKQKDDEWRRLQREWGKTWREVDAKNFYKSLDHQGLTFKADDKKRITAKYFVNDIEAAKGAQMRHWARTTPPQLIFNFADTPVLHDSLKMVYSFLDHSQGQYSAAERRSVESFLRRFVPLLCMYPTAEFNAACGPLDGIQEEDLLQLPDPPRSGRRSTGSVHSASHSLNNGAGVAPGDLRRKLLRTVQENQSATASRGTSPVPEEVEIWLRESTHTHCEGIAPRRPFFTNTTFYTLLRLLQLLYSRLAMCKAIGARLADEKHASLRVNPVATSLGLDDPAGPTLILAQTVATKEEGDGSPPNVVYMYLLDACEKVFDNELDSATFEEHMRWFFGDKAYHLFTIDKLVTALVKQVQTIVGDNKCQELWTLLQNAHVTASDGMGLNDLDILQYRREAERHVGQDDHLYRLQWNPDVRSISVHLMGADDPSVNAGDRWREYVSSYVTRLPTEWIPPIEEERLLLKRTRRLGDQHVAVDDRGLSVRISSPKYKIVYEAGAEDLIWWPGTKSASLEAQARVMAERRRARFFARFF